MTAAHNRPASKDAQRARRVSVVVVNWNGRDLLAPCFASLGRQSYPNLEVILVDNGSVDDSVHLVRRSFPWVVIVQSHENLGYAGGCNLGASRATGEYILLLNNDTVLGSDVVQRLANYLDSNPRFGAVSASAVGRLTDPKSEAGASVTINVIGKHVPCANLGTTPFYAPGACVLYRRAVIAQPFDTEYFAYDEDVYLSWLLRLIGYDVGVDEQAQFEHKTSSTSRRILEYVVYCAERNRWMNLLLFYETATLAKLAPLVIANVAAKVLSGVPGVKPKLRAYAWLGRNLPHVLGKRAAIQRQRTTPDEAITHHMTGLLVAGSPRSKQIVNRLCFRYLRLMGIQTFDGPATQNATGSFGGKAA